MSWKSKTSKVLCHVAITISLASLLLLSIAQSAAASCQSAPDGMACIPQGSTTLGSNKRRTEKPAHRVVVGTFYLDKHEVSNADYNACIKAGYCHRLVATRVPAGMRRKHQPVTYVSWYEATNYCRWRGKRLPTEAEWVRAARGKADDTYPWGKGKAKCKHAHFRSCRPRRPRSVKRGQAGHFGIHDLGGNVSEWVNDWYAECYGGCKTACGSSCEGKNPKGPCKGKSDCPKRVFRVIKGGSWMHGSSRLRASWRSGVVPTYLSASLGFRCASSSPKLHTGGTLLQLKERPEPPTPKAALPADKYKLYTDYPVDDLKLKKLCPKVGRSGGNCRDPAHYVKSNEKRQHLWRPYVKNLGGGYVGIGADQNYNLIAWARSSIVWLLDYDMVIYWVHKLHRGLILHSPTNKDFLDKWEKKNAKATVALLNKVYKGDRDRKMIVRAYRRYRRRLGRYFKKEFNHKKKAQRQHWLATPKHYKHIRTLYLLKRIHPMPGDLLKFKTLRNVMTSAQKLKVTVRIMYFSNAEEYWHYPPFLRETIKGMPLDNLSLVVRTLSSRRWRTKQHSYFHYNLHHGLSYQKQLNEKAPRGKFAYRGYRHRGVRELMERFRINSPHGGFTLISFPKAKQ